MRPIRVVAELERAPGCGAVGLALWRSRSGLRFAVCTWRRQFVKRHAVAEKAGRLSCRRRYDWRSVRDSLDVSGPDTPLSWYTLEDLGARE